MTEWQPIETAPLTEPVLVAWKNNKNQSCVCLAWKIITSTYTESEHAETFNLNRLVSYWSEDPDGDEMLEIKPTHWMLLPEPPK